MKAPPPFAPSPKHWTSRPVRNTAVREDRSDAGELVLVLERERALRTRLLNLVFAVPRQRRIVLDALGERVWLLCDGERTVRQIFEALRAERDEPELEPRLFAFFRLMMERRLLGMVVPEDRDG